MDAELNALREELAELLQRVERLEGALAEEAIEIDALAVVPPSPSLPPHTPLSLPLPLPTLSLNQDSGGSGELGGESEGRERGVVTHPRVTKITALYIEQMVTEFGPQLGGPEKARECIAEALNHKAMTKRFDKRMYLRTWLRREVDDLQARASPNGKPRRTETASAAEYLRRGSW
jgi:hypothetical protein